MRFLHLIKPVMCILPEVATPDRKVNLIAILLFITNADVACSFTLLRVNIITDPLP